METRLRKAANAASSKAATDQDGAQISTAYDNKEIRAASVISSPPIHVLDLEERSPIPRYTIDLSLPPRQRYTALATAYKHKLVQLPILFDEVLQNLHTQTKILHPWPIKQLARLFLRRIYDPEQMEELIGIQEATGIPMYLLVAFNILLDMFVGCTSGGVRVVEKGKGEVEPLEGGTMLHFRTLDWAMDPLRQIVVELTFVTHAGGPVVARSITYLGFVGVLTGVRSGLSISFNFRSNLKSQQMFSRWEKMQYIRDKLLVLLGQRPSLPCILRKYVIPDTHQEDIGRYIPNDQPELPTLDEVVERFSSQRTAQCFVIVSNGDTTTVIEKDWRHATLRTDSSFIVCTNHDQDEEQANTSTPGQNSQQAAEAERKEHIPDSAAVTGMDEILEESVERKQCLEKKWQRAKNSYITKHPGCTEADVAVPFVTIKRWLTHERITSACTHYSVIMDPRRGDVIWAERYPEPDYDSEDEDGFVPADRWSI